MAPYEPGLTLSPSPQAIEIVRDRLHRAGYSITEAAARSLLEAVLAVEGPRMQAITRGIMHGSLETIRQTAEVALSALKENRAQPPDLVGAVRDRLSAEPRPLPTQEKSLPRVEPGDEEEDDPRPVFKRRGR
jgi:hypothetical protein